MSTNQYNPQMRKKITQSAKSLMNALALERDPRFFELDDIRKDMIAEIIQKRLEGTIISPEQTGQEANIAVFNYIETHQLKYKDLHRRLLEGEKPREYQR